MAEKKKARNTRALCAQAAAVAFLPILSGCGGLDPTEPTIEYANEVRLDSTPRELTRDLRPGIYVVQVRERDIDIKVHVFAPETHVTLADDIRGHGVHATLVPMLKPGRIQLRLVSDDEPTTMGAAELRLLRLPARPQSKPGDLEHGYREFGEAGEQTALDTPEARARAAEHLSAAIAHFASAGDVEAVAQAQYTLANLEYRFRSEWQASIEAADDALSSFTLIRDATGAHSALTLRSSSEIELAAGMDAARHRDEQRRLFAHADATLTRAVDYFRDHGLRKREACAENMRGVGMFYRGDYADAATKFAASAALSHDIHDVAEELRSRGNLAAVRYSLGDASQAAVEYRSVLALIDKNRAPRLYAPQEINYGWALLDQGELDRAVAAFTDALQIASATGQKLERAVALSGLARTYWQMGDAERALPIMLDAAEESRRANDMQGAAGSLRGAGEAAAALGQHRKALELMRQALASTLVESRRSPLRLLIARELRAIGELAQADAEIDRALPQATEWGRALAFEERGLLRIERGYWKQGIDLLRKADAAFVDCGSESNGLRTRTELSAALLRSGDVVAAAEAAESAIAMELAMRSRSVNFAWRARMLSAHYEPYEVRIAAYFSDRARSESERSWLAFQVAEGIRARSLGDRLGGSIIRKSPRNDSQGEGLRQELAAVYARLDRSLQASEPDAENIFRLRTRINELRALLDMHADQSGIEPGRSPATQISLAHAQASLPASTAVLAFFTGDRTTHVWLLTRDELKHRTAPAGHELASMLAQQVARLRDGSDRAAANGFARALLGSLLDGIDETRLMVLADGPLHDLPFAALPIPGSSTGEQMVDRFVIAMAPSLELAMAARPSSGPAATRVAVVSDPVFNIEDRRLLSARDPIAVGLRGLGDGLMRLPYSAVEAKSVRDAFSSDDTIDLSGFDAVVPRVLALTSQELRVIHFATHAEPRADAPELSAVYLSRFGPNGAALTRDRLTAADVLSSGLHADLVVLSGCATGAGNELRGEGVLGLTYGFLANGSRAVVASLWQIEDAPTAQFMERFYAAYRQGRGAADALRFAQLETRKHGGSSVWSSFVVRASAFP